MEDNSIKHHLKFYPLFDLEIHILSSTEKSEARGLRTAIVCYEPYFSVLVTSCIRL